MEIFRTQVDVPLSPKRIDYNSKILFMGSCFSEYMGDKFSEVKFCIENNPFGIVYNPFSIKSGLSRLIDKQLYQPWELFQQADLWSSFDHHSKFSGIDKAIVLDNINENLINSSLFLKEADFLFITFGTSFVYELKRNGKIVSNCHKVPDSEFIRKQINIEEICSEYIILLKDIFSYNPDVQIIFTVSPVRHWKDGAHGNQSSKAVLLLAIDNLCSLFNKALYFPSYEIMLDDLRDYRFYAEDMLHPNKTAVNYIWQKVRECFMDSETIIIMEEIEKINQAFNHRPFNPKSTGLRSFAGKYLDEIKRIKDKYNIDLSAEEQHFRSFI